MASLVGSRVERKEDKKLLTGRGKYTADVTFAHQTYAYFVRSPHARAHIKNVDISKAEKSSGVVAVLTGKDIANDKIRIHYWVPLHDQTYQGIFDNDLSPDYVSEYNRSTVFF